MKDVTNSIAKTGGQSYIIWSMDGKTWEEIVETVRDPNFPHGRVIAKMDNVFLTDRKNNPLMLDAIDAMQRDYKIPVFADVKIAEIQSKTLALAGLYLQYRPLMMSAMASICDTGVAPEWEIGEMKADNIKSDKMKAEVDAIGKFADLCLKAGTDPCIVTVLTTKTPDLIAEEYNGRKLSEQVMMYAKLAASCGVTDIICPAFAIEALRENEVTKGLRLNVPGVRLLKSDRHEQKQVVTPGAAIKRGADRLIIGRELSEGKFTEKFKYIAENVEKEAGVRI